MIYIFKFESEVLLTFIAKSLNRCDVRRQVCFNPNSHACKITKKYFIIALIKLKNFRILKILRA